jgi:acetyl-CoA carboxylase carboxyl transferase subunit beta
MLSVMDFSFMGGSMGSAVGEKFVRACETAAVNGTPLISVTASGGARMQEGILSLMQLPKTVCAVEDLRDSRGALFNVMAHPTTAGVLASFGSLGDVLVAEPGALLSFTGPRVVQQTTRERLPDDFGLAESNLRFGHLDAIVPRPELRAFLASLLRLFSHAG